MIGSMRTRLLSSTSLRSKTKLPYIYVDVSIATSCKETVRGILMYSCYTWLQLVGLAHYSTKSMSTRANSKSSEGYSEVNLNRI